MIWASNTRSKTGVLSRDAFVQTAGQDPLIALGGLEDMAAELVGYIALPTGLLSHMTCLLSNLP